MKKFLSYTCALLGIIFTGLQAEIHEIMKMEEILPFIEEETVVVLDIDNTILYPNQLLGSDMWFSNELHLKIQEGQDKDVALQKLIPTFNKIMNSTLVSPVEANIAEFVSALQQRKIPVIACTARNFELEEATQRHLNQVGIDINLTSPFQGKKIEFTLNDKALFKNGVLMVGSNHKGECLQEIFSLWGWKPQSVIFVDDKHSHAKEVEEALCSKNLSCHSFRYGAADEKVKNYDRKIADVQLQLWERILSDDEASVLLNREASLGLES